VAFAALAVLVRWSPRPNGVEDAADAIRAAKGTLPYRLFDAVSFIGSSGAVAVGAVVLAAIVWWRWRSAALTVLCVLGPAAAGVGETVLKEVIGRPRPGTAPIAGAHGFGFPSGHATGAAALAAVVVLLACASFPAGGTARTVAILGAAGYAVAVAVSRVVLGVHFALDVLAGLVLGCGATLAAALVLLRLSADAESATGAAGDIPESHASDESGPPGAVQVGVSLSARFSPLRAALGDALGTEFVVRDGPWQVGDIVVTTLPEFETVRDVLARQPDTAVIVVSVPIREPATTVVELLDAGVDRYVDAPTPTVLAAQIRALARRRSHSA
jgi:membrane-associated phospholipid phosphatase